MTSRTARVLVLAGRGRYEDPWHDHAATSYRVALALTELRLAVEIRSTFPDAFTNLDAFDLIVVNSGDGRIDPEFDGDDARWAAAHAALHDYASAGRPVLGLHQAAMTFSDSPHWHRILGGRWVSDTSMHPPWGTARFDVASDHPIVAGLGWVETLDERYSLLEVLPGSQPLFTQRHDGLDHPVVWVNTAGPYRCVYDALGHNVDSYDSLSRLALLRREVLWLLGRDDDRANTEL
jgi:uncharacterized protein